VKGAGAWQELRLRFCVLHGADGTSDGVIGDTSGATRKSGTFTEENTSLINEHEDVCTRGLASAWTRSSRHKNKPCLIIIINAERSGHLLQSKAIQAAGMGTLHPATLAGRVASSTCTWCLGHGPPVTGIQLAVGVPRLASDKQRAQGCCRPMDVWQAQYRVRSCSSVPRDQREAS